MNNVILPIERQISKLFYVLFCRALANDIIDINIYIFCYLGDLLCTM